VVTLGPTSAIEPTTAEPTTSTPQPDATNPTTTPLTDVPPTRATTPSTTPATTPPATFSPGTTTTSLVCHNSHDPACGPLVYDPPFTNAPATVTIAKDPAAPVVGETVTFTMHITDPDSGKYAAIPGCSPSGRFGDGTGPNSPVCIADCVGPGYGLWDPPKTEPADLKYTFRHAYTKAGNYTAVFSLQLAQCEAWSSLARGSTVVRVAPS
jgi:hypothetical protein